MEISEIIHTTSTVVSLVLVGIIFGYIVGMRHTLKMIRSSINDILDRNKM